jgi:hypothetical protein
LDRRCPGQIRVVVRVVDQLGDSSCCERLGRASCEIAGIGCCFDIRKLGIAIALSTI